MMPFYFDLLSTYHITSIGIANIAPNSTRKFIVSEEASNISAPVITNTMSWTMGIWNPVAVSTKPKKMTIINPTTIYVPHVDPARSSGLNPMKDTSRRMNSTTTKRKDACGIKMLKAFTTGVAEMTKNAIANEIIADTDFATSSFPKISVLISAPYVIANTSKKGSTTLKNPNSANNSNTESKTTGASVGRAT